MMYKHSNIYPYQNRALGLSERKTSREQSREHHALAVIAVANLQKDDSLVFPAGVLTVSSVEADKISLSLAPSKGGDNVDIIINNDNFESHTITTSIATILADPKQDHSAFGKILERDPAVYRLRSQEGWVINDALCLLSGNIQYNTTEKTCKNAPKAEKSIPVEPETPVTKSSEPAQHGFDF